MISPDISGQAAARLPPTFFKANMPPSPPDSGQVDKTMNKITNFSIAAIMNNSRKNREDQEEEDNFEAKRRKLAEAVPALGKNSGLMYHFNDSK